jgi:RNA polymerase sigma-70 factor, ECF subfamily
MRDLIPDDAALVKLIAQAQTSAFNLLYDRYNRLVFSIAIGMLGDPAIAEEATLDVFVQVWRRAGTYRADQGKVSTWLVAITRHHVIDILRWQKTQPESDGLSWNEISLPDGSVGRHAEERAELSLQRAHVRDALSHLPSDQREVLLLAYFKGYSHSQIAEVLAQPLGTVKTRIRLGMQKLRQLLEED